MKSKFALALVAGWVLGACSVSSTERIAGGGFETSDVNAVLVDSSGRVVAGARIWLVQHSSDSLRPSQVIDSSSSDSSGRASVMEPEPGKRGFGLEAWLGDTLVGFLPNLDSNPSQPVQLRLLRPKILTLSCAKFSPYLLVLPGSHFVQYAPPVCLDNFFILLPPGNWKLFAVPLAGHTEAKTLEVSGDSLPSWRPPPPPPPGEVRPPPGP